MYNTTLDADILREIKILAAQLEMRQNDLIEEAIRDLMKNTSIWNLVYRMGDQCHHPRRGGQVFWPLRWRASVLHRSDKAGSNSLWVRIDTCKAFDGTGKARQEIE